MHWFLSVSQQPKTVDSEPWILHECLICRIGRRLSLWTVWAALIKEPCHWLEGLLYMHIPEWQAIVLTNNKAFEQNSPRTVLWNMTCNGKWARYFLMNKPCKTTLFYMDIATSKPTRVSPWKKKKIFVSVPNIGRNFFLGLSFQMSWLCVLAKKTHL